MGREKEAQTEAEDNFASNNTCNVCGQGVPLGEKDMFFETGLCGYCQHVQSKDD